MDNPPLVSNHGAIQSVSAVANAPVNNLAGTTKILELLVPLIMGRSGKPCPPGAKGGYGIPGAPGREGRQARRAVPKAKKANLDFKVLLDLKV